MIPYRSHQLKLKPFKVQKLKQIPSIQLVQVLNSLCQGSDNTYDTKNHILTINDINNFQFGLETKYNRSLKSFERQLKILGFKQRRYQYNQDQNLSGGSNQMRVYKWRGKKQQLIDQQLNLIETSLRQRKIQMENIREQIRSQRKYIDSKIQSIIFSMLIQFNSQNAKNSLNKIISRIKMAVNQSQVNIRKIIGRISFTLGNELQLYKLLIYKQNISEKRAQQRQSEDYGGNQNMGSEESEQNPVIQEEQSKNSLVSIEVDKNVKKQLKKQSQEASQ